MPSEKLLEYIKQSQEQGAPKDQIKKSLLSIGWEEKEIDKAFELVSPSSLLNTQNPNSNPPTTSTPTLHKKANLYLIISSVIIIAILSAGTLAYTKKFWPFKTKTTNEQNLESSAKKDTGLLDKKINEALAQYKTENPSSTEKDWESFTIQIKNNIEQGFKVLSDNCKNFNETILITENQEITSSSVMEFLVPGYGIAEDPMSTSSCLYKKLPDNKAWQKINSIEEFLIYYDTLESSANKIKNCQDLLGQYSSGEFGWNKEKINTEQKPGEVKKNVENISIAKSNSKIIYASVREKCLYKSIDGGNTWNRINGNSNFQLGFDWLILIDPANPNHIFTTNNHESYNQIAESTDGGINWQSLSINSLPVTYIHLDENGKKILAGTTKEISPDGYSSTTKKFLPAQKEITDYKSTDNGKTWTKITDQSEAINILLNNEQCTVSIFKEQNKKLAKCPTKAYIKTDKSNQWTLIHDSNKQEGGTIDFNIQFLEDGTIFINYFAPEGDILLISKNLGETWTKKELNFRPNGIFQSLKYKKIFSYDFNYLYESKDNGLTWDKVIHPNTFLYTAAINEKENSILFGGNNGVTKIPIPAN